MSIGNFKFVIVFLTAISTFPDSRLRTIQSSIPDCLSRSFRLNQLSDDSYNSLLVVQWLTRFQFTVRILGSIYGVGSFYQTVQCVLPEQTASSIPNRFNTDLGQFLLQSSILDTAYSFIPIRATIADIPLGNVHKML